MVPQAHAVDDTCTTVHLRGVCSRNRWLTPGAMLMQGRDTTCFTLQSWMLSWSQMTLLVLGKFILAKLPE